MKNIIKIKEFLLDEQQMVVEFWNGEEKVYDAQSDKDFTGCEGCAFHKNHFPNIEIGDWHCMLNWHSEDRSSSESLATKKCNFSDRYDRKSIIWKEVI